MSRLIQELYGTICRCGKLKAAKQTFCGPCYFALPLPMRKALYRRVGEGYEQAYAAASEFLETSGTVSKEVPGTPEPKERAD